VTHFRANLDAVSAGTERAGRTLADVEIDVSIPVCISADRERARRAARRLAGQAILWMAGVDRYSQLRTDWQPPAEFNVDRDVIEALRTRWDMWSQPDLPAELAALITDDVLDQFTVAGEPGECAARLERICAERPEATGIRIQAHPAYGMPSYEGYAETVRGMGEAIARVNGTYSPKAHPHPRPLPEGEGVR
jgi:alkanesulfonate monooxygenase SsuD/methylene tetrahydromethanopterin reductase-like flavin-dependent oxidoreductase (luciferase family)